MLRTVSLHLCALTACCFRLAEISGTAWGVEEQHRKVERELFELQMGTQLSVQPFLVSAYSCSPSGRPLVFPG